MTLREARLGVSVAMVVVSFVGAPHVDAQSSSVGEHIVYSGPAGVRCDAAGRIFVADDLSHRIVVVSPVGPARIFGGYGSEPGRLLYADAVHWRRDGSLLVADTASNRIQVWTPDGRFVSQFGHTPTGVDAARRVLRWLALVLIVAGLVGLVLRVAGPLHSNSVVLMAIALGIGAILIWAALTALFPPGLSNPRDVWVDADDQAYVADFGSDVIRVFDANGRFARTIGRPGDGPGELRGPLGVTIDTTGHVLVTDSGNHRVLVFTRAGAYVSMFGGEGKEAGRFQSPHGIAVGPNGRRFVADRANRRIQILDLEGRPLAVIDRAMDGSPFTPVGVCLTGEGDLVASDSGDHRVLRWPADWVRDRLTETGRLGLGAGSKVPKKHG